MAKYEAKPRRSKNIRSPPRSLPALFLSGDRAPLDVIDVADRISRALGIDDATSPEQLIKAVEIIDDVSLPNNLYVFVRPTESNSDSPKTKPFTTSLRHL